MMPAKNQEVPMPYESGMRITGFRDCCGVAEVYGINHFNQWAPDRFLASLAWLRFDGTKYGYICCRDIQIITEVDDFACSAPCYARLQSLKKYIEENDYGELMICPSGRNVNTNNWLTVGVYHMNRDKLRALYQVTSPQEWKRALGRESSKS